MWLISKLWKIKQLGIFEPMVEENRTLEFRELLAFSQAIKQGGVTAAADNLGLSKSTVSLQISRLEQRLGVKLLERNSRRIALTREGERLLPRITSLLEEGQLLIEESKLAVGVPGGTVRIAVTPAFGSVVLKKFIPRMRETHPDMRLIVEPSYYFDDLQDPNYDFAIRVGRINDDRLVANKVGTFRRMLVASPDLLREFHPAKPGDLAHMPCLVFSGKSTQTNWRLEHVAQPDQVETIAIQSHVAVRSFQTLLDLAEQGLGVALVPKFMVQEQLASGCLLRCLPNWHSPSVDVMLAYRFGASKVARVGAALEECRDVMAGILEQEV